MVEEANFDVNQGITASRM